MNSNLRKKENIILFISCQVKFHYWEFIIYVSLVCGQELHGGLLLWLCIPCDVNVITFWFLFTSMNKTMTPTSRSTHKECEYCKYSKKETTNHLQVAKERVVSWCNIHEVNRWIYLNIKTGFVLWYWKK